MLTAPFPEKRLDFRNVTPSRNVFDAFVVNRKHGGTDKRLSCWICQFDLNDRVGPRLVVGLRGDHFDVDDPFFGGNDNLFRFLVVFPTRDGKGFQEEVGHILLQHADLFDRALSFQSNDLGWQVDSI